MNGMYAPVRVGRHVCKEYMNQGALSGALAMQESRGNSQLKITSIISAGTCKEGRSQRTCRLSAAGIAYVPSGGKATSGVAGEWYVLLVFIRENECNMNHCSHCRCTFKPACIFIPGTLLSSWASLIMLRLGFIYTRQSYTYMLKPHILILTDVSKKASTYISIQPASSYW